MCVLLCIVKRMNKLLNKIFGAHFCHSIDRIGGERMMMCLFAMVSLWKFRHCSFALDSIHAQTPWIHGEIFIVVDVESNRDYLLGFCSDSAAPFVLLLFIQPVSHPFYFFAIIIICHVCIINMCVCRVCVCAKFNSTKNSTHFKTATFFTKQLNKLSKRASKE